MTGCKDGYATKNYVLKINTVPTFAEVSEGANLISNCASLEDIDFSVF